MSTFRSKVAWTVGGFAAAVLLLVAAPAVIAEPKTAPTGCAQWELMVGTPALDPTESGPPPTVGIMALPTRAPKGWEPFTYAPGGQVAYRRCAP